MLGVLGPNNGCDACGKGTMCPVITSLPVTVMKTRVLVPGVMALRCDRCGEFEWSGPEADRARQVARLLAARQVA